MSTTLRRYSQAANWLDKRKIRKQIKQAWRGELRQAELDRAHQLTWTANSVETFRAHSLAVSRRANDPNVDHDRRYRDAQALARHRNDMAERVLRNPRLTEIEQGIALDQIDAATAFPHISHGHRNPLQRARRVKGIEALRYRAQVARAREAAGIERPGRESEPIRYTATVASQAQGSSMWLAQPTRRFVTEQGAVDWMHRQVADTHWHNDTRVQVEAWDLDDTTAPIYADEGRPDTVRGHLAAHATDLRERGARPELADGEVNDPWRRDEQAVGREPEWITQLTPDRIAAVQDLRDAQRRWTEQSPTASPDRLVQLADSCRDAGNGLRKTGLSWDDVRWVTDHPAQIDQSLVALGAEQTRPDQERTDLYSSTISWLPEGEHQVVNKSAQHASERESANWTRRQLDAIRPAPGTSVHIAAYDHDGEGHWDPVFRAEGARSVLAQEVDGWREGIDVETYDPATEADVNADLARDFSSLQDRHRLAIQYNNQLVERNAALVQQLTALTAERDKLRGERDEAVRTLVERTPAEQRLGSPERQAAQARDEHAPERDGTDLAELRAQMREAGEHTTAEHERQDHRRDEEWADAEESARDYKAMNDGQDRRDAKQAKTRPSIPGHAFAGLVNGREQELEMER
ncbi:hypothetical protein [Nocardia ninae]|nr:hypothetical protein [Nocardia ninae]